MIKYLGSIRVIAYRVFLMESGYTALLFYFSVKIVKFLEVIGIGKKYIYRF
nr:MAG TPA: hypothetical protein [Caudoviricetes sp.]